MLISARVSLSAAGSLWFAHRRYDSMVTLTEVSLFFFFLVLCIALRKCSTPHSAGSSSKGGVSWRRSHSLPLFSAVKLHWTVIAPSIVQQRSSVIAEDITPA
ncbi:hypothetical protein NQZ68_025904 [Dissostichus eleginoides]|nr:hypothetical protein NQZ68_025904 [Dissostichus eleginoides]